MREEKPKTPFREEIERIVREKMIDVWFVDRIEQFIQEVWRQWGLRSYPDEEDTRRVPAGGAFNEYLSGLDVQEVYGSHYVPSPVACPHYVDKEDLKLPLLREERKEEP